MQQIRKEYAPSRLKYKLFRWWLTPSFRRFVFFGLPLTVCTFVGLIAATDPGVHSAVGAWYGNLRSKVTDRPEFMVDRIEISGLPPKLEDIVRDSLTIRFPISSMDLDLDLIRNDIEAIDAVKSARLKLPGGGALVIEAEARRLAMLWRGPNGLEVLDPDGVRVAVLPSRKDAPNLPVIAGIGADRKISEAMEIYKAALPLNGRIRGLEWRGERRWDMVLDRNQTIKLPENDPVMAVERLIGLDQAAQILARDVSVVDLRDQERIYVRIAEPSLELYQEQRLISRGDKL